MQAKAPSTASYAWKSIIRGREVIRKGAQWRIGDGHSVRIWGDRWIPEINNPRIISPILHGQEDAKVSCLIDQHQRMWKDDILDHSFYEFEANLIRKIPLCKSHQQDVLIWPFTSDGDYSVKSGYKFLQNDVVQQQSGPSNTDTMKPLWTALWGLNVPGKIRNFLWRSCQNSLPTKANLMRRKIITEDLCEQCKCHKEDVLHALYGCPAIEDVWRGKPNWTRASLRQANCFTDLLGMILAGKNEPELFGWVVWDLWNRRNNLRLGKATCTFSQLLEKAVERKLEATVSHQTRSAAATRVGSWTAPDLSWYKINFDGAVFVKEDKAGLGVVIRNSEGLIMASLSQLISLPYSVVEVETLAARRALELAVEIGIDRVVLEGDSAVLMQTLKNGTRTLAQYSNIANDILYLAPYFSDVQFSHVSRSCNKVAHSLARRAPLSSPLSVWMEEVPPDVEPIYMADLLSLTD